MRLWCVRLGSTSGSDGVLAMRITARIDISPLDPAGTYLLCSTGGATSLRARPGRLASGPGRAF